MADVASPLRPYARRFAIEPTKIQILIGTESAAAVHEVPIFIAEKECHGIGRHRGTDNFRSKERAEALPSHGLCRLL
jgi:hypothetical protein